VSPSKSIIVTPVEVYGKRKIKHEHGSVPFDMKTGKASLDLKP